MCLIACWAPSFSLMPEQASLFGSGAPLDRPLEGHSLKIFAIPTPGLARNFPFYLQQNLCNAMHVVLQHSKNLMTMESFRAVRSSASLLVLPVQ